MTRRAFRDDKGVTGTADEDARRQMASTDVGRAWMDGAGMTLKTAIEYALSEVHAQCALRLLRR